MVERTTIVEVSWVLDERPAMRLSEFCTASGVIETLVIAMVDEGILEPHGSDREDWRFSGLCLARARCALRLRRDFSLDWPGIAFALPLLEEVQALRRRQRALLRRLGG